MARAEAACAWRSRVSSPCRRRPLHLFRFQRSRAPCGRVQRCVARLQRRRPGPIRSAVSLLCSPRLCSLWLLQQVCSIHRYKAGWHRQECVSWSCLQAGDRRAVSRISLECPTAQCRQRLWRPSQCLCARTPSSCGTCAARATQCPRDRHRSGWV